MGENGEGGNKFYCFDTEENRQQCAIYSKVLSVVYMARETKLATQPSSAENDDAVWKDTRRKHRYMMQVFGLEMKPEPVKYKPGHHRQ